MFLHGFQIHRVPYWKLWKRTRDSRFWSILHVFVDKYKVLGWPKSSFETSITSYGLPWWLRCLPAMQETWVRFLGREYPLKKEMAIHSSTLAWKIPWTEEPDRLQSMGSQRVGHDWVTSLSLSYFQGLGKSPREGNGKPLQYSCLENPMDRAAWQAYGVTKSQIWLSDQHFHFQGSLGPPRPSLANCLPALWGLPSPTHLLHKWSCFIQQVSGSVLFQLQGVFYSP